MSELKCCPFCGGKAEIRHNVLWFWVQCKKCKANSRESSNEDLAIEYWNTRTPMDNIVEKLEEKTEFLKDCTKYGNESAEQQEKSYSTMMMYEVADLVDDLIDVVKQEINNGLE